MKNINKVALAGGLVFAILDIICAFLIAFAFEPFMSFWNYVTHVKVTGLEIESAVTAGSVIGGAVFFFALGYVLTWLFTWLCGKNYCKQ